jgi:hypothetical protein
MNIRSPFSAPSAQPEPGLGFALDAQPTHAPSHRPLLMHAFLNALDPTATPIRAVSD